jgi:hypothetical protein
MRIVPIAALLVGAGVPVFCQSAGMAPPSFEIQKKDPASVVPLQSEISKGPPVQITLGGLLKMNVPPGIGRLRMPGAPGDSAMVVHPPQASIGVQVPGTQVAQNLYPGLELMPIHQFDQSKAKVARIPTTFPNMKIDKIPTTWPQYTVLLVQSGKADSAQK